MNSILSVPKNEIFTSEILINKSRFLGYAQYVQTTEQAEAFLNEIRAKHNDARHIAYAYKLSNTARASDDGVIIVVVRYFGGIKLGAGGLLRAYSGTANAIFETAEIVEYEPATIYEINLDYSEYKTFLNSIKGRKVAILNTDFSNGAEIKFVAHNDETFPNARKVGEILFNFEGIK